MTFKKREPAVLENATWNQELMEQFKSPQHKLNMYNYHLKQHGFRYAQRYAENAQITGNYKKYLPECDPWRDKDICTISCNYYNHSLGCMLLYQDLNLGGINPYED